LIEQLHQDEVEEFNQKRSFLLKALLVLAPEQAKQLMDIWPPMDGDNDEQIQTEDQIAARLEEIKKEGGAGKDEELAAFLKERKEKANAGRAGDLAEQLGLEIRDRQRFSNAGRERYQAGESRRNPNRRRGRATTQPETRYVSRSPSAATSTDVESSGTTDTGLLQPGNPNT